MCSISLTNATIVCVCAACDYCASTLRTRGARVSHDVSAARAVRHSPHRIGESIRMAPRRYNANNIYAYIDCILYSLFEMCAVFSPDGHVRVCAYV